MRLIGMVAAAISMIGVSLVAQDATQDTYRGRANSIVMHSGNIKVYEYDWDTRRYNDYVDIIRRIDEHRVPFLLFYSTNQKWLFLSSPYFASAFKNSTKSFFDGFGYRPDSRGIIVGKYSATSFLNDSSGSYPPANLRTDVPSRPWVEGIDGDGVGETISIKWATYEGGKPGALIISNGFVSYDKPQLYEMNSRVRRIRITDPLGAFSIETELADTPNPQVVFLPSAPEQTDIEILSVYPGTSWNDTCINFIYGYQATQSAKLRALMLEEGNAPLPVEAAGSRNH